MAELPNIAECELMILGYYAAVMRDGKCRRADGMVPTNKASGLPESANHLLPRNRWITGSELALNSTISPKRFAEGCLFRTDPAGIEEDKLLSLLPKDQWTPEEASSYRELCLRLKRAIRSLAQQGVLREDPAIGPDGEPMAMDEDGFCLEAKVTYSGLLVARQRVRGTKYEKGSPVSLLDVMTTEQRKDAPQWAKSEWAQKHRA